MALRIAADIGGTFTDIALIHADGRLCSCKLPSTPADYGIAVVKGVLELLQAEHLAPGDVGEVLHGCTVATNVILENKGARTALLTTEGFRDVLEMRRIRVPRLYEPLYVKPAPLVPRHRRLEVRERLDASGRVLQPLDDASVGAAIERLRELEVDAIAVCLLHSYANPDHERRLGAVLSEAFPNAYVSLSVDVLPEIREYERTSTTVINSYVGPPVASYLESLADQLERARLPRRIQVMQSSGGIVDAESVVAKPAQIIECGPAAGVIGARHLAHVAGWPDIITFDMGGTTAKASLIEQGRVTRTDEYEVGGGISLSGPLMKGGGYALKLPVIDISEVGAGGGSIVWIDKAGALKVGPQSAGAEPGPVCYDAGGTQVTITDANVVLGYLNPDALAGGTVPIRSQLSRQAITRLVAEPLGMSLIDAAYGIHEVANNVMVRAVKSVTTYRGRDPRDFALLAFGGNGGIHAIGLARELHIERVIVPPGAGVFSAIGLLFAEVATSSSATLSREGTIDLEAVERVFSEVEQRVARELGRPAGAVRFSRQLDLRYAGQAFELTVPVSPEPLTPEDMREAQAAFEREHGRTYGHRLDEALVEMVAVRVTGTVDTPRAQRLTLSASAGAGRTASERTVYFGPQFGPLATPVIDRAALDGRLRQGPLIIEEYEGTTIVPPDCRARLDDFSNIVVELPAAVTEGSS